MCGEAAGRRGLLPRDQEASCLVAGASASRAAGLLPRLTSTLPRDPRPSPRLMAPHGARTCRVCCCPRSSTVALRLQTDHLWRSVVSLSCHPVSSLWQNLSESRLAKVSGKGSLQAFNLVIQSRAEEEQVWPNECRNCLGRMNVS